MAEKNYVKVGGQLQNIVGDGIIAYSKEIKDEVSEKTQEQINTELQQGLEGINEIESLIPAQASESNQLADKNFVNNQVSTNTANFVGTYNSLAELQAVQNPTNNDYGFVIETDAQGNEYYDRYKYNGSQWLFEYKVESTPFTAEQWAAIQSGITSALVTKLSALPTNTELTTQLNGKQATLVSGTNIKTINNEQILGAGNIEIGGAVDSVNGKTGVVVLDAEDVGALPDDTPIPEALTTVNVSVDGNVGTPSGSATISGNTISFEFSNLKGETGAQGPKGDTVILGDGNEYTLYNVTGQNTDGAMTQQAATNNFPNVVTENGTDLDIADDSGNVLVEFSDGHVKTKNFDSRELKSHELQNQDFAIADSNNNNIVEFSGGHVKTKKFDSRELQNVTAKFKNKKFAIIGDSISTYSGWLPSDISGYSGSTYATYYPSGNVNSVKKTWWYKMLLNLGISPSFDIVNNCSWSGSRVTGDSTSTTSASAGCSTKRISDLAVRGYNPDIVIVFISCNDFANDIAVGTWDVNSAIPAEGTITEMRSAYSLMINKIHVAYPSARVFCCTNLDDYKRDKTSGYPSNNNNGVTTYTWNQSIMEIAEAMGCDVINMHDCGLNYANISSFTVDAGLHPNEQGMEIMARKVASELIAKY